MSLPNGKLLLFVADDEPNSRRAKANLRSLPAEILGDSYDVEIIDVLADFRAAVRHSILVTPSLLVQREDEEVLILGDLSDGERVRSLLQAGEANVEINEQ
jgi:circadian clock protein KaiB